MEQQFCLSKEQRGIHCDSDRIVSEIIYKPVDLNDPSEKQALLCMFWEFWLKHNGEDLSEKSPLEIDGKKTDILKIESVFYYFVREKFDFQLAYDDEKLVGFLMHRHLWATFLIVPAMFIEAKYFNKGIGVKLVDSLKLPIKKILFQTRKNIPPDQFLKSTKNYRRLVAEDNVFKTWEMNWGSE